MKSAADKGGRLFHIAASCVLSTLLFSPTAEASRNQMTSLEAAVLPPMRPDLVVEIRDTNPQPRHRLFGDVTPLDRSRGQVAPQKTVSGVFALGNLSNIGQTRSLGLNRSGPAFHGAWTDPVTGIAYHRARWYDPRNASFLSEDPFGDVDSPNLYSFVAWQPHMERDPTGEFVGIDNAVAGVVSVGIGWGMSKVCEGLADTDEAKEECQYTGADAFVDFSIGFATTGLSHINKAKKLGNLAKWTARVGAESVLDVSAEMTRHKLKGEEFTFEDAVKGAVLNAFIGEGGSAVGRRFGKRFSKSAPGNEFDAFSDARIARFQTKIDTLRARGPDGISRFNERLAELQGRVEMLGRGYTKVGHGKYDSIHGIDAVYRNAQTGDIALLESKYRRVWTSGKDVRSILGRGYGSNQMSAMWIEAVRQKMVQRGLSMASVVRGYQRRFVNVVNERGESFFRTLD